MVHKAAYCCASPVKSSLVWAQRRNGTVAASSTMPVKRRGILLAYGFVRFDVWNRALLSEPTYIGGGAYDEAKRPTETYIGGGDGERRSPPMPGEFKPVWFNDVSSFNYFRGVADHLRGLGYVVEVCSSVPWAARLEERGLGLRCDVERFLQVHRDRGVEDVHIIGHSMGGLDSRQMCWSAFDAARRGDAATSAGAAGRFRMTDAELLRSVACISTVSTPHLGSAVADWFVAHLGERAIATLSRGLLDVQGVFDLTTEAAAEFNRKTTLFETTDGGDGLRRPQLRTYASIMDPQRQFWVFRAIHAAMKLSKQRPASVDAFFRAQHDGLVTLESSLFDARRTAPVSSGDPFASRILTDADHFNELGWNHWATKERGDALLKRVLAFYQTIAANGGENGNEEQNVRFRVLN